ncbi:pentapeptide repeat-containing protein [Desulfobulbus sp. F1]|nr:pentapeptide repeat-containing protein [Desulfobulbus sp. F1]
MANRKQLRILKQGVAVWNKWREEHPDVRINLRWAKLNGLDLRGGNFHQADIRGTSFKNSKLNASIFSEATAGQFILLRSIFIPIISIFSAILLFFVFFCTVVLLEKMTNKYMPNEAEQLTGLLLIIIGWWLLCSFVLLILLINISLFLNFSKSYLKQLIFILIQITFLIKSINGNRYFIFFIIFMCTLYYLYFLFFRKNEKFNSLSKFRMYLSTIFGTDFRESNLIDAIYDKANLKYTRFGKAILVGTSFKGTQGLEFASCNSTILNDPDVRELLVRGNGQYLSLKGKNMQGAHLVNADLRGLDLRETELMQANLSGADITGAKLYGSARENWIIDGIRCDYVYWDEAGEQRTPPDRDFRPGEFEELYKQLPTFEYVFAQGFTPLDPLIMDRVVQAVNERHKEFSLELVNFDKRGQPHATFTVCHLDYVDAAKGQLTVLYENTIAYLMKENEEKNRLIKRQNNFIDQLIKKTPSIEDLKQMGDTYNIHGGQIGAVGQSASASGNTFQQITADLSRLHEEMQRSAKTPEQRTAAEDVAKAAQAASEQNEPAMQRHLKNAGRFAVDCAKSIGTEALSEYLKKITLGM